MYRDSHRRRQVSAPPPASRCRRPEATNLIGTALSLSLSIHSHLWISECRESKLPENQQAWPVARPRLIFERYMMMSRKSLWLGLIVAVFAAALLTLPASAKPKKRKVERRSGPPTISLLAEPSVIKACADEGRIQLTTNARSETGRLRYRWSVNGGRLRGDGPSPMWDLAGVAPGVYQAIVDVDDGDVNCVAFSSISVVVLDCPPPPPERPVCPSVSVSCPEAGTENLPVTFTANLSGGTAGITPTYNWTISAGRIISGQGTPSITD